MKRILASVLVCLAAHIVQVDAKDRLEGFVLRGDHSGTVGERNHFDNPNGSTWARHVDGIVVQAEWAHLQPNKDGAIRANNVIDQAISAVTTWNNANPSNKLGIKLRVFAGIYSPGWVGDETGEFFAQYKNGKEGYMPFFWKAKKFRPLWSNFQTKLAAKYDSHPLLREVAVSGCMTHNAETMWRNPRDNSRDDGKKNIDIMRDNGLTLLKDENCLKWQIRVAASKWPKTHIGMAYNMWQDYENGNAKKPEFVNTLMDYCIERAPGRCILGNNSLGVSDIGDENKTTDVTYYLRQKGDAGNLIYVQTETVATDIHLAIDHGADRLHAAMAELPKLKALNKVSATYLQSDDMQDARLNLKTNN
ncbi:hypothetical protein [Shewanella woodyi]|uniref:Uncharacterized protein n=1 Tax=Shewanella woodyi (strain ATCC 51908 / MS32) TaxID=392500 RepID=B1KD80_SHEWM|nr:hypothetical protein [Shewanella woodyi]ACA87915.1 hypothetical protein Swoo_3653 [Shewanella woodyi ATCC 51908]